MGFIKRNWPLLAVAACVLLLFVAVGRAHHAPSGWEYPNECCSGHQDCVMIHTHNVEEVRGGYQIRLAPGEHPHAPDGFEIFVPFRQGNGINRNTQIKHSGDSDYHVCIGAGGVEPYMGSSYGPSFYCLYVPPGGV